MFQETVMRRTIRLTLASVLAVAALAGSGCGVGQPTAGDAAPDSPAPAALEPTGAVYIELPAGWRATKPTNAQLVQSGENTAAKARFTLAIVSSAKFDGDLDAWAAATKLITAQTTKVTNRQETELTSGRIGEHAVVEYQITGDFANMPGHLRVIMLQTGDWFCKVTCISFAPAAWDAAQPKFDELIDRIRLNDKWEEQE
jgi:hypothetical protein